MPHDPLEPIDPDVTADDLASTRRAPATRAGLVADHADILAVVSAGGVVGALGRWGVAEALPHEAGAFATSTFVVNVVGALLLGALMVVVVEVLRPTRLVRPFLGVGVLGGFTTFSTYSLDTRAMLAEGRPGTAAAYLLGTLALGLVATWLGLVGTRALVVRKASPR